MKKAILAIGLLFFIQNVLTGQPKMDFENLGAQTFSSPNCLYNDANFTTSHILQNFNAVCGEIVVQANPSGDNLGFEITWSPTGGNAGSGFSDNDAFGVATSASLSSEIGVGAFDGNKGFVMEDTDGDVRMEFTQVDLTGTTAPSFSMAYALGVTSWETTDVLFIYIEITDCPSATTITAINTTGIDIDGNFTEGAWVSLNEDLSAHVGCKAQLFIEASTNAAAEEMGFDAIQFSEGTVLPVELTSFEAVEKEQVVQLTWETGFEINNEGFEIEKSIDGRAFSVIGYVPGLGNTNITKRYRFTDSSIDKYPTVFYRLRQIDLDGTITKSKIISLNRAQFQHQLGDIFPNPSKTGQVNINFAVKNDTHPLWTISLFDIQGKLLHQREQLFFTGQHQVDLGYTNLTNGIYFIQFDNQIEQIERKLYIQY